MLRIATTALAIAGGFLASAANGVHPPKLIRQILPLVIGFAMLAASPLKAADMSDSELENLVRRSYQYVALFNTINNFAVNPQNPFAAGGWNRTHYPTGLMNASVRALPRPNNDTLYVLSLLDLRKEPVIIHYPAFGSKYVSLETTAFDHYCEIPLAASKGDFKKPTSILYYSARTEGYSGEPVEGVDRVMEMSGDFAIAFLRVMPEANDLEKFKANMAAVNAVKLQTLSEFQGKPAQAPDPLAMPAYSNDQNVFASNFQEAMQFVFNHTTFDPEKYEMDREALAALKAVGVEPGRVFDQSNAPEIDGKRLAEVAAKIAAEQNATWNDPQKAAPFLFRVFLSKGQIDLDTMVIQSVVGPVGVPASEAMYPGIATTDGAPMNAEHDYVIRMTKDQLPPANAFWSATLYDTKQGFFIPNKENKYSVGENAGMKLDESGGIAIYIAAERPEGVPTENWLPITRENLGIDVIMRVYEPHLEKMKTWVAPKAEMLNQ
ncbi:DUF1214 domain-containing protein [Sinorhizobium medicae]|uniref:DUF1214 domain-containing protein n=1 Tax=Sinorhizobium medicae TaxID=110321 RepID=UPI000C7B9116|nr:DUF1214 domain-containing protein [Sinorhizobium medicae]PLT98278.1 hypothetical protein BMJ32_23655 [Sinorhizobium medicae]PLU58835.1 hypothetical protein BMJ23_04160 [Sinorhizobium medicae]